MNGGWGHAQAAVLLRRIGFATLGGTSNNEPNGDEMGWGVDLTGSLNLFGGDDRLLLGGCFTM